MLGEAARFLAEGSSQALTEAKRRGAVLSAREPGCHPTRESERYGGWREGGRAHAECVRGTSLPSIGSRSVVVTAVVFLRVLRRGRGEQGPTGRTMPLRRLLVTPVPPESREHGGGRSVPDEVPARAACPPGSVAVCSLLSGRLRRAIAEGGVLTLRRRRRAASRSLRVVVRTPGRSATSVHGCFDRGLVSF